LLFNEASSASAFRYIVLAVDSVFEVQSSFGVKLKVTMNGKSSGLWKPIAVLLPSI